MPFQSEKQRRYLHANHPEIAKRWEQEYAGGGIARLPFENGSQWYNPMSWDFGGLLGQAKEGLEGHNAATQSALDQVIAESGGILQPDLNKVNKMSMIPDNFIENLQSLWGGNSTAPAGIMKPGMERIDPTDGNFIPRQTMANWSQFDDAESGFGGFEDADAEAAYTDYASGLPTLKKQWNFPDVNLSNVGDVASGVWALANDAMPWGWAKRGWDTLTSGFSGGEPRDPNLGRGLSGNVSWMGSRYDKEHGVGSYRDKNIRDWQRKYGHIEKKTAEGKKKREWFRKEAERIQKEKADAAKAAAAANRRKVEQYTGRPMSDYRSSRPASERQFTGHGKSGMGRSADRFA